MTLAFEDEIRALATAADDHRALRDGIGLLTDVDAFRDRDRLERRFSIDRFEGRKAAAGREQEHTEIRHATILRFACETLKDQADSMSTAAGVCCMNRREQSHGIKRFDSPSVP